MKKGTPIILCIGSDKIAGDSVGPTVGDYLRTTFNARCFVYGVTDSSVNGKTLPAYIEMLKVAHKDSPVIAVDACLSNGREVGNVEITANGVNPKRALSGRDNKVGDVGILGVVSSSDGAPLATLMTVSIDKVEKICYKIALVIYCALFASSF